MSLSTGRRRRRWTSSPLAHVPVPYTDEVLLGGGVAGGCRAGELSHLTGAEFDENAGIRRRGDGGHDHLGGNRTAGGRGVDGSGHSANLHHRPIIRILIGQIEAPNVAEKIARVHIVGDVIAIQVGRCDVVDSVRHAAGTVAGAQIIERGLAAGGGSQASRRCRHRRCSWPFRCQTRRPRRSRCSPCSRPCCGSGEAAEYRKSCPGWRRRSRYWRT